MTALRAIPLGRRVSVPPDSVSARFSVLNVVGGRDNLDMLEHMFEAVVVGSSTGADRRRVFDVPARGSAARRTSAVRIGRS